MSNTLLNTTIMIRNLKILADMRNSEVITNKLREVGIMGVDVKELWIEGKDGNKGVYTFVFNDDIYIHNWVHYPADWFVTWKDVGLERYDLGTKDIEAAKEKAREVILVIAHNMRTTLTTMINAFDIYKT